VAFRSPLFSKFRGNDLAKLTNDISIIEDRINTTGQQYMSSTGWRSTIIKIDDVELIKQVIVVLTNRKYGARVESGSVSLYSNDDDFINAICSIPGISIEETSEPDDEQVKDFLLANPKAIIRAEFTHQYKVTISGLDHNADAFKEWAEKLPKIKTTKNKYQFGGYFYVADEKTLSLCHIYLSDKIRKVEKLVTASEI
jgi:hypothetical protein